MAIFRKSLAFTLAEVLVVLGIIGVVSALTLPNLSQNTGNKEKVAKVQKAYSTINEAVARAEAEYGPIKKWRLSSDLYGVEKLGERISENLKVSKNCGMNKNQGCIDKIFYDKTNKNVQAFSMIAGDSADTGYKVILADGMALSISAVYGSGYWLFLFDIDGPKKGSSMLGKDIFFFTIILNSYPTELGPDLKTMSTSNCFSSGFCTKWVIDNGNMDYLKADTSGKCPNGKVLSDTVTTCK